MARRGYKRVKTEDRNPFSVKSARRKRIVNAHRLSGAYNKILGRKTQV